ncbi:LytTR family transcriptional regulator [Allochromatium humboldtianum]|uniref:LytTR family transcriptional regulator n=2 Tax=Allochromatium humboldtianum TaxID=504901 RepID=A0A850RI24_9GAMM|nr:LytTR family transcriptional regulator [Allochromatium humboldtianum]
MKTLDAAGDRHRAEPCWSASTRGPDDSMEDRNRRPPGMCARDLEIRAYYRGRHQRVSLTDVIYLRADQKYVCVHHLNGVLLVDSSLCAFEHEFPDLLLRIHRNALVARSRLVGLEKQPDGSTRALLTDCDDRPVVSRRHLRDVRGWLRERLSAG